MNVQPAQARFLDPEEHRRETGIVRWCGSAGITLPLLVAGEHVTLEAMVNAHVADLDAKSRVTPVARAHGPGEIIEPEQVPGWRDEERTASSSASASMAVSG